MQINIFTIPVGDSGSALQEMNIFLKAHKILEIQQKLISNDNGANWCSMSQHSRSFRTCVKYANQ
jgi:hypothetical protein